MTKDTSTIITRPTDPEKLRFLSQKLEEYTRRIAREEHRHPDLWGDTALDAWHKRTVLETLLTTGVVDSWQLSEEMFKRSPEMINPELFDRAVNVIIDYCETGGKNTHREHVLS